MDVILQTGEQLHAHRLQLYASSAPRLQALPNSSLLCSAAEELGIRESDYRGPCLVLLRNCKLAPEELHHHIRSNFLKGYVVRVYWCAHATASKADFISHLNNLIGNYRRGYRLATSEVSDGRHGHITGAANKEEKTQSSVVQRIDGEPLESWISTDEEVEECESKLKVRLQTYPRELAELLVDELTHVNCQPHGFSHSLYAVHVDGVYRYGVAPGTHMYLTPCDREDMAKGSISRASLKLEEVLQVLGFRLLPDMIAMDLGASPGAWTQYLSKHIKLVVAVDPAPLHKQVLQPNVAHIKKMAQDATQELVAWSKGKGFDLLVCDINRHPVEAAQVVSLLLVHLQRGGLLVLTLKFHGRGRDKKNKVDEIKSIFQGSLTNMDCIWLLANSIYERTFVGIKT